MKKEEIRQLLKMIYKLLKIGILVFLIISLLFLFAVKLSGNHIFDYTYQSVIQAKYKNLIEINDKKIVIVGGSNNAFGIDGELLSEKTGYEVVNLGLHAAFGMTFIMEMSKENINEGDIVILSLEYGWNKKKELDRLNVDLVMSGIDTQIEMYKYIPLKNWRSVISNIDDYLYKKKTYNPIIIKEGKLYSSTSFDSNGNMIFLREDSKINENIKNGVILDEVNLENVYIDAEIISYFKEYKKFIESRGAKIYFTFPSTLDTAISSDISTFYDLMLLEENLIGIPYISIPENYFYDHNLMYDTIYHCNSEGQRKRTLDLAEDISKIIVDYSH